LLLTNAALSLLRRETAAENFPRIPSCGPQSYKIIFCQLLLDGSRAIDFVFKAAVKQSFGQQVGPNQNHVQDQNALTREKSGAVTWRLVRKQSRQQTANVNEY
jgi:hypothetical protein